MATLTASNITSNSADVELTNYANYTLGERERFKDTNTWKVSFFTNIGANKGRALLVKEIDQEDEQLPIRATLTPLMWYSEHTITAKIECKIGVVSRTSVTVDAQTIYDNGTSIAYTDTLISNCSKQWWLLKNDIQGSNDTDIQDSWHDVAEQLRADIKNWRDYESNWRTLKSAHDEWVRKKAAHDADPAHNPDPGPEPEDPGQLIPYHIYYEPAIAYANQWNNYAVEENIEYHHADPYEVTCQIYTTLVDPQDLPYWTWAGPTGHNIATQEQFNQAYDALTDITGHANFNRMPWEIWEDLVTRVGEARDFMGIPVNPALSSGVSASGDVFQGALYTKAVEAILYPFWSWRDDPTANWYIGRHPRKSDFVYEVHFLEFAEHLNTLIKLALEVNYSPLLNTDLISGIRWAWFDLEDDYSVILRTFSYFYDFFINIATNFLINIVNSISLEILGAARYISLINSFPLLDEDSDVLDTPHIIFINARTEGFMAHAEKDLNTTGFRILLDWIARFYDDASDILDTSFSIGFTNLTSIFYDDPSDILEIDGLIANIVSIILRPNSSDVLDTNQFKIEIVPDITLFSNWILEIFFNQNITLYVLPLLRAAGRILLSSNIDNLISATAVADFYTKTPQYLDGTYAVFQTDFTNFSYGVPAGFPYSNIDVYHNFDTLLRLGAPVYINNTNVEINILNRVILEFLDNGVDLIGELFNEHNLYGFLYDIQTRILGIASNNIVATLSSLLEYALTFEIGSGNALVQVAQTALLQYAATFIIGNSSTNVTVQPTGAPDLREPSYLNSLNTNIFETYSVYLAFLGDTDFFYGTLSAYHTLQALLQFSPSYEIGSGSTTVTHDTDGNITYAPTFEIGGFSFDINHLIGGLLETILGLELGGFEWYNFIQTVGFITFISGWSIGNSTVRQWTNPSAVLGFGETFTIDGGNTIMNLIGSLVLNYATYDEFYGNFLSAMLEYAKLDLGSFEAIIGSTELSFAYLARFMSGEFEAIIGNNNFEFDYLALLGSMEPLVIKGNSRFNYSSRNYIDLSEFKITYGNTILKYLYSACINISELNNFYGSFQALFNYLSNIDLAEFVRINSIISCVFSYVSNFGPAEFLQGNSNIVNILNGIGDLELWTVNRAYSFTKYYLNSTAYLYDEQAQPVYSNILIPFYNISMLRVPWVVRSFSKLIIKLLILSIVDICQAVNIYDSSIFYLHYLTKPNIPYVIRTYINTTFKRIFTICKIRICEPNYSYINSIFYFYYIANLLVGIPEDFYINDGLNILNSILEGPIFKETFPLYGYKRSKMDNHGQPGVIYLDNLECHHSIYFDEDLELESEDKGGWRYPIYDEEEKDLYVRQIWSIVHYDNFYINNLSFDVYPLITLECNTNGAGALTILNSELLDAGELSSITLGFSISSSVHGATGDFITSTSGVFEFTEEIELDSMESSGWEYPEQNINDLYITQNYSRTHYSKRNPLTFIEDYRLALDVYKDVTITCDTQVGTISNIPMLLDSTLLESDDINEITFNKNIELSVNNASDWEYPIQTNNILYIIQTAYRRKYDLTRLEVK